MPNAFTTSVASDIATVAHIRELIILQNGRYNLVPTTTEDGIDVPDYTRSGDVDYFINAAMIWLCDNAEWMCGELLYSKSVTTGDYYFDIPNLRELKSIMCRDDADDSITPLYHREEDWMKTAYGEPWTDVDQGEPYVFCESAFWTTDSPAMTRRFIFMPPADGDYTFQIRATFYPPAFPDSTDQNWILLNHPHLLITCALWLIEAGNKNDAGADAYKKLLDAHLVGPTKDYYERVARQMEDANGLLQMEDYY